MSAKYKGTRPWAVGPPASRLLGGGGHISHAASPCIQQGRPPVPRRARSTVQPSQEPVPEVSLSPESAPSHGEGESHTGSAPQARRAEVTVPTPGSAPSPVQNSRPRQATHSSRPPTALSTARPQDHAAPMAPARSPLAQEEGGAWSLRGRRASPGLGHTQTRASFMGVRPDRRGQRPAQRPGTLCQAPPLLAHHAHPPWGHGDLGLGDPPTGEGVAMPASFPLAPRRSDLQCVQVSQPLEGPRLDLPDSVKAKIPVKSEKHTYRGICRRHQLPASLFFERPHPRPVEAPGPGMEPRPQPQQRRTLAHGARPGSNPCLRSHSSCCSWILNPLCYSGNSTCHP